LRAKGQKVNHKFKKTRTDDDPRCGPIRNGSVFYRMLEMIAAEIAKGSSADVDRQTKDRRAEGNTTKAHIDGETN
jgi:hypothetical protein